jgi:GntR family transcriptional regulator
MFAYDESVDAPARTPLWSQILSVLQERIMDETYAVGSYLPTEMEFVEEFGASRPVVNRALNALREQGWVTSWQGKGRLVRRRGGYATRKPGWGLALVSGENSGGRVGEVGVQTLDAPPWVADAFGWSELHEVVARRRLLVDAQIGPLGVVTVYVPASVAAGTDLVKPKPVRGGVLAHLSQRRRISFDYLTQRVSARPVTAAEAVELDVAARSSVLRVLVSVADDGDVVQVVADAVIVGSRVEIQDSFPLR